MEMYRRSNIFDHVLALYTSVLCLDKQRIQILELTYRSIKLGGGMTLITRLGIENWFAIQKADGKDEVIMKEIGQRLWENVDVGAAQQWRHPTTLTLDAL